ncbi:zinc finger MYM-type protein 6-like [Diabrotica undecimpunctata]|uniref:zinc finger MYM-type protein 6-like n=1 Tax=Diabrotica undecimpunctata TaxID=50387 RepID=UPI003B638DF5
MSKQMKLSGFFKKTDSENIKAGCSTSNIASDSTILTKTSPKRKAAHRKYNLDYIACGFTFIEEFGIQLPQCVICAERKETELKSSKNILKSYSTYDEATLKASYNLSLKIAKTKKSFTVGEELVLPCIVDATKAILGDKCAKQMQNIPLSNVAVSRRIEDMASDVETQLLKKIHSSKIFAVKLDESTEITNKAILLVYIRFIDKDNKKLSEEFLTSIELQGNTIGKDIFKAIDGYFTLKNLSWKDCVGLCSDGAAAMTGHKTGLPSFVRQEGNRDIVLTHYIIHREMLAAKGLSPDLNKVLTTVVKAVNFIKSNALSSRLLCYARTWDPSIPISFYIPKFGGCPGAGF